MMRGYEQAGMLKMWCSSAKTEENLESYWNTLIYHTLSGSPADGFRGRTGNSNPSTSWMIIGFTSITDTAGGEDGNQHELLILYLVPYSERQEGP